MTPPIQGKSRMREIRPYGSVRGVRGDSHPYRDFSNSKMTTIAPARVHGKHREATSAGPSVNPGAGLPPGVRAA